MTVNLREAPSGKPIVGTVVGQALVWDGEQWVPGEAGAIRATNLNTGAAAQVTHNVFTPLMDTEENPVVLVLANRRPGAAYSGEARFMLRRNVGTNIDFQARLEWSGDGVSWLPWGNVSGFVAALTNSQTSDIIPYSVSAGPTVLPVGSNTLRVRCSVYTSVDGLLEIVGDGPGDNGQVYLGLEER